MTVDEALADIGHEWHTTQEIAAHMGVEWRAGSHDLTPVRDRLYYLHVVEGAVDYEPRRNGHRWKLSRALSPSQ